MAQSITPALGYDAIRALLKETSPLGQLKVPARHIGRSFQIPLPGFKPFVVFGPEANRKVLFTGLLRRGILVTDGKEHDRYRKLIEPSLHPQPLCLRERRNQA